jgi:hypothetical protein
VTIFFFVVKLFAHKTAKIHLLPRMWKVNLVIMKTRWYYAHFISNKYLRYVSNERVSLGYCKHASQMFALKFSPFTFCKRACLCRFYQMLQEDFFPFTQNKTTVCRIFYIISPFYSIFCKIISAKIEIITPFGPK